MVYAILGDPGALSRDETSIGTGVKFSSKARRAPGNIPLMDEFQSDLNSDYLIGWKFSQLYFFRPIREPHTMKSDRDSLYQLRNATSTVAIFFSIALLVWLAKQTYHAAKIWVAKGPARFKIQKILLRKGNLYMCKIKMLSQNTFEEPTRNKSGRRPIAREGTSRLLVFRFSNYRRELILVFLLHGPDMSKHCHRPFSASHIRLPVCL